MSSHPRECVQHRFQTPQGTVELLAEVEIEGATLHLRDIAIYPTHAESLELGTATVMQLRRQLIQEAITWGFERLRITATRYSGAKPGKTVDILISLKEKEGQP